MLNVVAPFFTLLKAAKRGKRREFFFLKKCNRKETFFWSARAYTSNADEIQDANVDS
jgi:hypothetical protein